MVHTIPHHSHSKTKLSSLSRRSSRGDDDRIPLAAHSHGHGATAGQIHLQEDAGIPAVIFFLDNRLPSEYFKQDILKLIHHLKISRWRRWVHPEMAQDLKVNRISGALTNAIYSIEPPAYIKDTVKTAFLNDPALFTNKKSYHQWMPARLLLRVYGPQVDHLIDRDTELAILQRLAQKDIGPKLLGTFTNGRFEQFLDAVALTKEDLKDQETSVQISKRMRELHDNISLLPKERVQGAMVWVNFDKWMIRAVQVLNDLESKKPGSIKDILQTDLDTFVATVSKYRKWLLKQEGGEESIKRQLVFAHNDTQYGNILRFVPPPGSPLLAPRNEHRQLVVIDFEYSAANVRGFDISNHFCEWMNDYHHETMPHNIWEERYPSKDEQLNLIQGYVEHGYDSFDDEDKMAKEVDALMAQVRNWRPSVHLYWCVWGIVQAVVDEPTDMEMREKQDEQEGYRFIKEGDEGVEDADDGEVEEDKEEDFFDYVAYASQKAQLFWSDMIQFGMFDEKDYHGATKYISN